MSFAAVWWSGASVTILIYLSALFIRVYRYKLGMKEAYQEGAFPVFDLDKQPLTASQVKTGNISPLCRCCFCSGDVRGFARPLLY
ncbi:hypothetical protein PO124_13245 [Bacillus licheniformis]|nr:hypothetical protein [Bacillus licheniformis]